MDAEYIVIVSNIALVLVTYYYARLTKMILREQKKTAELTVAPDIGFQFQANCVHFTASGNSLYNLTARALIKGKLKHEQFIGNAVIPKDRNWQSTYAFDLSKCFGDLEVGKEFTLTIEISYESRSGSILVEQYDWEARIDAHGQLLIHGNHPKCRRVLSAPWSS